MRVDVVIDDELLVEAMAVSGLDTEKDVIEEALRMFIQVVANERVHELWNKRHWEGDLSTMREGRVPDF